MKIFTYKAILFNDTRNEYHHGCSLVIKNIFSFFNNLNVDIIKTFPSGINHLQNRNLENFIKKVDLIIVNGEGTIHHSQINALNLLKIGKFAKSFNKKTILINSIFDTQDKNFYDLVKYFDLINVRDRLSKSYLNINKIKSIFTPDFSFYIPEISTYKNNIKSEILFTDSVNKDITFKLIKIFKKKFTFFPILKYPYDKKINFFNHLRKIKFFTLKFIHILFKNHITNNYEVRFYGINSLYKYVNKITNSKIIITGRYHALCFAIQNLTPFIAIESNSHKISALLDDIGLPNRIVDINNIKEININHFSKISEEEQKLILIFLKKTKIFFNDLAKEIEIILKQKN